MADLAGYNGQLLEVDLTSRTSRTVPLDPTLAREYIGGRAMGVKMLWDEYGSNWANINPLGPDAVLLILVGPLNGFCAGKTNAVFKSALSEGAVAAQVSGDMSSEIRFAGYDGFIIRGKADTPVYLYVHDDKVELRDARDLWGMDTRETHRALVGDTDPTTQFLYIGPAGENLVKFAAIMANWYKAMARGGPGSVMGSKNLKAIAVKGNGPAPEIADQETMYSLIDLLCKEAPLRSVGSHEYGTTRGIYGTGFRSSEPVRNWQGEWHDERQIQGEFFAAEQWQRWYWSDFGCTTACCKIGRIKQGKHAGEVSELPDYEGGAFFGPNLGIFNIQDIPHLCDVGDRVGIDHISGATAVSFAAELYQRGILTKADVGGLDLSWGNADAFEKLIHMIGNREGIGDTLAEGTMRAAKIIGKGTERYATHVKGIEYGAHGVRSGVQRERSFSPRYAIATQGGDHMSTASPEHESAILNDSLVLCSFWRASGEEKLKLLNAATGFGITDEELNSVLLPRWTNLQWATLLMSGWTHEDTTDCPRFFEPLPDGPYKGLKVEKAKEQEQIQEAFKTRGWSRRGVPTSETLENLGLPYLDDVLNPYR